MMQNIDLHIVVLYQSGVIETCNAVGRHQQETISHIIDYCWPKTAAEVATCTGWLPGMVEP